MDGPTDIFVRRGKNAPGMDEDIVRSLHAEIGDLAVVNDLWSRKLKA